MENIEMNSQQPINSTPEGNGGQAEKLFTQADLDRIIGERLSRAKADKQDSSELEAREKAVAARETALKCREYVLDMGYPLELLDTLDTADADTFMQKADKVYSAVHDAARKGQPVAPLCSTEPRMQGGVAAAFARDNKHTPRPFPPRYEE